MNAFADYYKKHLFKQSRGARLAAIDFLINEIDGEINKGVDPTRWRHLLDDRDTLEKERDEIAGEVGDLKMQ